MITYLLLTLVRWLRPRWHKRYGHGKPLVHENPHPKKGCYFCTRYKYALQDLGRAPAYCPVCNEHYLCSVPREGPALASLEEWT